ncbi:MAG: PEP/pyruvate-binding domain-containing protein, partial [Pseudomonas sp.]|nr:PEP/pyruvate-binding domain-containing protein [Pseudomonas sp.]
QLQNASQAQRFAETARLMVKLREMLSGPYAPELRLVMLDTSLALEAAHFAAATELNSQRSVASRQLHIAWLGDTIRAAYGAGVLSKRQYLALEDSLSRLVGNKIQAAAYKRELNYLALVPGWAGRQLELHFQEPVDRLTAIEPLAELFIQSLLRGGPLLFYSNVLDDLLRDANRLTGVHKTLFGREVGAGIRALNPGMAKGKLYLADAGQDIGLDPHGIYILPETTSRLPPVAGIITAGEGNLLSHVQLLARNLGIPNVVVDSYLVEELTNAVGNDVLLAVSPGGSVQLAETPTEIPKTDNATLTQTTQENITFDADLDKLDLKRRDMVRLADLRADDSGRLVGPKAAKLGELYHHFPEAVADGLVIPFGEFRTLLEQPYPDSGMSMFEWMRMHYRKIEAMPEGTAEKAAASETLRRAIHDWILSTEPDPVFRTRLREAMTKVFGIDGSYGVFVRSDTNIEDLPGFSGAGLNLTVPNVVGFDEIFAAVHRVWASPFSQRACAWRQGKMTKPEHVYPAVLLMRTVPVDKSGVMITRDVDSGDSGWLSVAINEGIGG